VNRRRDLDGVRAHPDLRQAGVGQLQDVRRPGLSWVIAFTGSYLLSSRRTVSP
jgi:hypothetical protein